MKNMQQLIFSLIRCSGKYWMVYKNYNILMLNITNMFTLTDLLFNINMQISVLLQYQHMMLITVGSIVLHCISHIGFTWNHFCLTQMAKVSSTAIFCEFMWHTTVIPFLNIHVKVVSKSHPKQLITVQSNGACIWIKNRFHVKPLSELLYNIL